MPCKYANVEQVCQHCYSRNFMDIFKQFFRDHAYVFRDAPLQIRTEQNLQYYELFQKYLRLFEDTLSSYIQSLNMSMYEFYEELSELQGDPSVTDKKLLHFVTYLAAVSDYDKFYKLMARSATNLLKKRHDEEGEGGASMQADGKHCDDDDDDFAADSKHHRTVVVDDKGSDFVGDSKHSHK